MRRTKIATLALAAVAVTALSGCAPTTGSAAGQTTVEWWTWDPVQADAYSQCIPAFEADHPDVTVSIKQYNVSDYFTKLTAGFVAEDAPDAFMISTAFLESYASQGQLLPLDDRIAESGYDMSAFAQGVELWQYTDGVQYGLPMDWAAAALYYNEEMVQDAGLNAEDMASLTWDPETGGSFRAAIAHLTVDENGVRGDETGFDPEHVATYGIGSLGGDQLFGDSNWGPLVASTGASLTDAPNWPTTFEFAAPEVRAAFEFAKGLADDGFSPKPKEFTTGGADQLGTGAVAMLADGSWVAGTFAQIPGTEVGTAPVPSGPDGTRGVASNINGNVLWAGSEHPDATWDWISYQESEQCQTTAAVYNASFLPSNAAATAALVEQSDVDLSVFGDYVADDELIPIPALRNGTELDSTLRPIIADYFAGEAGDEVFQRLQDTSASIIAGEH